MTGSAFLDVATDVVARSGGATAGTAGDWDSWGDRSRVVLGAAEVDVRSAAVADALAEYATAVVSAASQVGRQVSNLGVETTSAAVVIEDTDAESAALLQQHRPTLARPVNSEWVAG